MGQFHAIKGIKQHHSVNHNTWQRQRNILLQRLVKNLPITILYNFCGKYLILNLANRTNLRWKILENNNCELFNYLEVQLHIFSNCKLVLDWYEWRHNWVISTICNQPLENQSKQWFITALCWYRWLRQSSNIIHKLWPSCYNQHEWQPPTQSQT